MVVHGAAGASATGQILPPFEGAPTFEQDGALEAPPGCGCEVYPAPTEYDYAPAPTITSVSTVGRPRKPRERDGRNARDGSRQRPRPLHASTTPSSANRVVESSVDYEIAFASGTEMQIVAPALAESARSGDRRPDERAVLGAHARRRLDAGTGRSTRGCRRVSGVESTASTIRLEGMSGALDTGGTPIADQPARGCSGRSRWCASTTARAHRRKAPTTLHAPRATRG